MTDTYSIRQTAVIGGSTLSLGALAILYGFLSYGLLVMVFTDPAALSSANIITLAFVLLLTLPAMILSIITAVLQVRRPQVRFVKLTARFALAWPVIFFGFFAILVTGFGLFGVFTMPGALSFVGLFLCLMLVYFSLAGLLLILPALRNGLFPHFGKLRRTA